MSTSDDRFEQQLAELLEESAPGRPPARLVADTEREIDATRRWPGRWATLREPPMRHGSAIVVGSASARWVAVVAATLLLVLAMVGAGVAGANLLAGPATIVVDQAGGGDTTTIGEAVAMAEDGDTILIRPGTYVEAVIMDTDVSITGDGQRASIIWSAPEDGPTGPNVTGQHQYALRLDRVSATLRGITLRGQDSAVHVAGGNATLAGLTFDGVGEAHTFELGRGAFADAVALYDFGQATVTDSDFRGGGPITAYEDSVSIIERNTLNGGPSIHVHKPVDGSVVRGNRISGSRVRAIGVYGGPSQVLIEDNVIDGSGADGIEIGISNDEDGNDAIVRGNEVSGAFTAISAAENAGPTITDNMLTGNDIGVWVTRGVDHTRFAQNTLADNDIGIRVLGGTAAIEDNIVEGGATGIQLVWDAEPTVTDNTVAGATTFGLSIDSSSSGTIAGNHICDNATNLDVEPELEGDIRSSNEICEDAAIE